MHGLIYVSNATLRFTDLELLKLCEFASNHNQDYQISGWLHYDNNRFIQYIEGEKPELERLFLKISNDNRHQISYVMDFPDLSQRLFSQWHMANITSIYSNVSGLEQVLLNLITFMQREDCNYQAQRNSALRVLTSLASLKND